MNRSIPKIFFFSFFLLGVTLSGFGRALPIASRNPGSAPESVSFDVAAASATPFFAVSPVATVTPLISFPTEVSRSSLFAFIDAPAGAVNLPYVTLTGFQAGTYSPSVTINGTVNTTDFICNGSPCTIPLQLGESRLLFKAQSTSGISSETIFATVLVELRNDGYHVTIESVSQFARQFTDACRVIWDLPATTDIPSWLEFPPYPYLLNTDIPLHHLAARLITYGLVDTHDCPAGGLSQDMDWPNGCGLERATPLMIQWQNQFDDAIWTAAGEVGIPPKILKTLIEVESQFWPANQRFFVDEYGLGQVNQLGVDVLLRNNYSLYQQVCSTILPNCLMPYVSLAAPQQALVRGALMASQNSSCASCAFGLDLTKAKQSITFIAQVIKANCQETKDVLDAQGVTTNYGSYWAFTMLAYHSGLTCLSNAVRDQKTTGDPVNWENMADKVNCPGGRKYVDNFFAQLGLFDSYRYSPGAVPIVQFTPVFSPTRTPLPTSTPVISTAIVAVTVYIDQNGDGTPQPSEGLNGIPVQLVFPDGRVVSSVTQAGQARFDLSGTVTGTQITATLPNLYRSYRFYLPQSGVVPIIFTFAQPTLPGKLP